MESGLEFIKVVFFFEVDCWPGTGFWLDHRLKSGYILGEKEGVFANKGKISAQINPWHIVDFSSDIFQVHNRLLESLWYMHL